MMDGWMDGRVTVDRIDVLVSACKGLGLWLSSAAQHGFEQLACSMQKLHGSVGIQTDVHQQWNRLCLSATFANFRPFSLASLNCSSRCK